MMKKIKTPDRPYFLFAGKMWEIENEFKSISGDRHRSVITFEHITRTAMFDDDHKFNGKMVVPNGEAWTIIETVIVTIDDEFADPEITLIQKNTGTMVDIKPQGRSRAIPAIEEFSLPLYHIEKLVREAIKIDTKNRTLRPALSPKFHKLLEDMNAREEPMETANI